MAVLKNKINIISESEGDDIKCVITKMHMLQRACKS